MNRGLKAIRRLLGYDRVGVYDDIDVDNDFEIAEEHLKALDIIIEKEVSIVYLIHTKNVIFYNAHFKNKNKHLTEREYDDLKEIFE